MRCPMHLFRLGVVLTAMALPLVAETQPTPVPGPGEPVEPMIIEVVQLTYARSAELAHTLSLIAPPGVRVAPYNPTNSLVIRGPRASVEQLIDIIKAKDRD
jgi:type II secretory pathway component GspD/PulD (secretin)